jgi:hypothetical protein
MAAIALKKRELFMTADMHSSNPRPWPELPLEAWQDSFATLHMWTQIVGKVRLALSPRVNHWWEVPLYLNARGLTTSAIPYGDGIFEVQFDFIDHTLTIQTSWNSSKSIALKPQSVAVFYSAFMAALKSLGIEVKVWPIPVEVPNPVPFETDTQHASYDPEYAHRFWQILILCDIVFKEFRAGFVGKNSPVHFFWGSFDLAVTRFSGHRAPPRPEADSITREAYSHEEISAGFWPGGGEIKGPAFYAYAAWFFAAAGAASGLVLSSTTTRVSAHVRRGSSVRLSARDSAQLPREHLRSGREPRALGPQGIGKSLNRV